MVSSGFQTGTPMTTLQKPKIIMTNKLNPGQVLYAIGEAHATLLLNNTGFKTNPGQIAASLNPRIPQPMYLTWIASSARPSHMETQHGKCFASSHRRCA